MTDVSDLIFAYRLPVDGWPRAEYRSTFGHDKARVIVEGRTVIEAIDRHAVDAGLETWLDAEHRIRVKLVNGEPRITVDGAPAEREDHLAPSPSRSAWLHAWIALAASFFGFAAGYLYLTKAQAMDDPWAMKMATHMAGWHLLLTLTLFPASVWGRRGGIRAVHRAGQLGSRHRRRGDRTL